MNVVIKGEGLNEIDLRKHVFKVRMQKTLYENPEFLAQLKAEEEHTTRSMHVSPRLHITQLEIPQSNLISKAFESLSVQHSPVERKAHAFSFGSHNNVDEIPLHVQGEATIASHNLKQNVTAIAQNEGSTLKRQNSGSSPLSSTSSIASAGDENHHLWQKAHLKTKILLRSGLFKQPVDRGAKDTTGSSGGNGTGMGISGNNSNAVGAATTTFITLESTRRQRQILLKKIEDRTDADIDYLLEIFDSDSLPFLTIIKNRYGQPALRTILRTMKYEQAEKNERIFKQGDRSDKIYVVLSGQVRTFEESVLQSSGKEVLSLSSQQSSSPNQSRMNVAAVGAATGSSNQKANHTNQSISTTSASKFKNNTQSHHQRDKSSTSIMNSGSHTDLKNPNKQQTKINTMQQSQSQQYHYPGISAAAASVKRGGFYYDPDVDAIVESGMAVNSSLDAHGNPKKNTNSHNNNNNSSGGVGGGSSNKFIMDCEDVEQVKESGTISYGTGMCFGEIPLTSGKITLRGVTAFANERTELAVLTRLDYSLIISPLEFADINTKIEFLRTIHLFSEWEDEDLRKVGFILKEESIPKQAFVFQQAGTVNDLFIIKSGEFRITRTGDIPEENDMALQEQSRRFKINQSILICVVSKGEFIGEDAWLNEESRAFSVQCNSLDGCVFRIKRSDFEGIYSSLSSKRQQKLNEVNSLMKQKLQWRMKRFNEYESIMKREQKQIQESAQIQALFLKQNGLGVAGTGGGGGGSASPAGSSAGGSGKTIPAGAADSPNNRKLLAMSNHYQIKGSFSHAIDRADDRLSLFSMKSREDYDSPMERLSMMSGKKDDGMRRYSYAVTAGQNSIDSQQSQRKSTEGNEGDRKRAGMSPNQGIDHLVPRLKGLDDLDEESNDTVNEIGYNKFYDKMQRKLNGLSSKKSSLSHSKSSSVATAEVNSLSIQGKLRGQIDRKGSLSSGDGDTTAKNKRDGHAMMSILVDSAKKINKNAQKQEILNKKINFVGEDKRRMSSNGKTGKEYVESERNRLIRLQEEYDEIALQQYYELKNLPISVIFSKSVEDFSSKISSHSAKIKKRLLEMGIISSPSNSNQANHVHSQTDQSPAAADQYHHKTSSSPLKSQENGKRSESGSKRGPSLRSLMKPIVQPRIIDQKEYLEKIREKNNLKGSQSASEIFNPAKLTQEEAESQKDEREFLKVMKSYAEKYRIIEMNYLESHSAKARMMMLNQETNPINLIQLFSSQYHKHRRQDLCSHKGRVYNDFNMKPAAAKKSQKRPQSSSVKPSRMSEDLSSPVTNHHQTQPNNEESESNQGNLFNFQITKQKRKSENAALGGIGSESKNREDEKATPKGFQLNIKGGISSNIGGELPSSRQATPRTYLESMKRLPEKVKPNRIGTTSLDQNKFALLRKKSEFGRIDSESDFVENHNNNNTNHPVSSRLMKTEVSMDSCMLSAMRNSQYEDFLNSAAQSVAGATTVAGSMNVPLKKSSHENIRKIINSNSFSTKLSHFSSLQQSLSSVFKNSKADENSGIQEKMLLPFQRSLGNSTSSKSIRPYQHLNNERNSLSAFDSEWDPQKKQLQFRRVKFNQ